MELDRSAKQLNMSRFMARRRQVLKGGLAAAAATMAPGFIGRASAAPADPLHFVGWQYNPQIVEENVGIFEQLYDENVSYELVPGEYHAIAETKMMGGQKIDMMYSEEDHIARWERAGWTRPLDGLPGLDEIKSKMYAVNVKNMSMPDGSLGGLPYYTGFESMVVNTKHMEAAKIDPPATWEELLDQARKLKTDKVSEYPFLSAWQKTWPGLSWSIFSHWYSEGSKVFDENNDPAFDDAFKKTLEFHRTIFSEQLIPPDVMTHIGLSVPAFSTGQHTFFVTHDYEQKVINDPATSQMAGQGLNVIMPGATRSSFIWTAVYQMGAEVIDEMRAWNLMQFFGGKAKDGEYHVAKRWALEFGLGTPHKEVIESPEVQEAFSKWKDIPTSIKQLETSTTRDVAKTMWFPEWDWFMMGEVQDYIQGNGSTDELTDKLHAKALELKELYPE